MNGKTERNISVAGSKASNMVRANYVSQIQLLRKVFGKWVNALVQRISKSINKTWTCRNNISKTMKRMTETLEHKKNEI